MEGFLLFVFRRHQGLSNKRHHKLKFSILLNVSWDLILLGILEKLWGFFFGLPATYIYTELQNTTSWRSHFYFKFV